MLEKSKAAILLKKLSTANSFLLPHNNADASIVTTNKLFSLFSSKHDKNEGLTILFLL